MSLFAESSWEANAVGDKLSKEIFDNKKNKSVRQSGNKKLTTNHAKRRANKRKKALADAIESSVCPPKKWARKSKPHSQEIVVTTEPAHKQEKFTQPKLAAGEPVEQETKSQRRRKKRKLNKNAEKLKTVANDQESTTETSVDKSSPARKLNIQRLETMLAVKEKTTNNKHINEPESLRERMMSQLRASRFRFLNETLYNNESSESKKYFKEDPDAFAAYHSGYKQQIEQWPLNPLDIIISSISKLPKDHVIADFGCGEARLAESVPQKVHSFDLVAINDRVKACDMAHTTLLTTGVNVVVFCLSLMGTNLADYLLEANRVLKKDGILKIADVESRFENVDEFITLLKSYGFVNTWKDLSHNLFYFMDFKKLSDVNRSTKKLPPIALKPCLYKKR